MTHDHEPPPAAGEGLQGQYSVDQAPDGDPLTINVTVTAKDPELQAIESILVLLQLVDAPTRFRVLQYVTHRIEGDAAVWNGPRLNVPDVSAATNEDVARVLAAADGRTWSTLSDVERSPYLRRVDGLVDAGMTVLAAPRWSPS